MRTQLSATLENARNYTLAVAAAMPAEHYSFKPAEGVFTFAELLHHISYGISWWQENHIHQQSSDWNPPASTIDKKSTIKSLEDAFAALQKDIEHNTPTGKGVAGFHATIDHITHHRGQATTYLRCKDIVPPDYVY
jgi:uncharacterized damage-inducible protein DinB